jgi:hypothetical protein
LVSCAKINLATLRLNPSAAANLASFKICIDPTRCTSYLRFQSSVATWVSSRAARYGDISKFWEKIAWKKLPTVGTKCT